MNALPQLPPEGSPAWAELRLVAGHLARNEVHLNVSSLVSILAGSGIDTIPSHEHGPEVRDLAEQAVNLMAPVEDWEEAMLQAGHEAFVDQFGVACWRDGSDGATWAGSAQEAGEAWGEEPYRWEVFECWAVSQSLGEDLAALGERVDDDFAGLVVWARTTTGVSFAGDDLFLRVAQLIQQRAEADCWDDGPDLEGASSTEAGRYAAKAAGKMLGPKP